MEDTPRTEALGLLDLLVRDTTEEKVNQAEEDDTVLEAEEEQEASDRTALWGRTEEQEDQDLTIHRYSGHLSGRSDGSQQGAEEAHGTTMEEQEEQAEEWQGRPAME